MLQRWPGWLLRFDRRPSLFSSSIHSFPEQSYIPSYNMYYIWRSSSLSRESFLSALATQDGINVASRGERGASFWRTWALNPNWYAQPSSITVCRGTAFPHFPVNQQRWNLEAPCATCQRRATCGSCMRMCVPPLQRGCLASTPIFCHLEQPTFFSFVKLHRSLLPSSTWDGCS